MENDTCFWAFLAGYLDAEGYIGIDRNRARFQVTSHDVIILNELRAGLVARGILCPPVRLHLPKGAPIKKGRYYTKSDSYCLSVNRRVSLDKLFEQVEPHLKHAKRRTDMMMAWETIKSRGHQRLDCALNL